MIYTSYFASKKFDVDQAISIARKTPINIPVYLDLAPPMDLVLEYKRTLDQSMYVLKYSIEVLSKLDPEKVARDLDNKILLCYEKTGDFCHRHIVGKWLKIYTKTQIEEL